MDEHFTTKELDTLIDALDCWEQPPPMGAISAVLQGGASPFDPEVQKNINEMIQQKQEEIRRDTRQRKEVSTLLKVKIIMMKQSRAIESAVTSSNDSKATDK